MTATVNYKLRVASLKEVESVALVFRQSRKELLDFLPDLHSFEEDIQFFQENVFPKNKIVVAEDRSSGKLVGFIAYKNEHIDHLYILPEFTGKGIGVLLLDKAKTEAGCLNLWVFQANEKAVSFYRRNGFSIVQSTDGKGNEEKLPDYLMQWRR